MTLFRVPPSILANTLNFADKLCEECKYLVGPSHNETFTIFDQLYEKCNNFLSSVSCQTSKQCKHDSIEDKLCKNCENIVDNASCPAAKSYKHVDVYDQLCKYCQCVTESAPCQPVLSCNQAPQDAASCCSGSDKQCQHEDKSYNTTCCFLKPCKFVDKACNPCFTSEPTKAIRKLHVDKACDPAPFQSVKIRNLVDKSCNTCFIEKPVPSETCEPAPFLSIKTYGGISCGPCTSTETPQCELNKLCKYVDMACDPSNATSTPDRPFKSRIKSNGAAVPFQSIKVMKGDEKSCGLCKTREPKCLHEYADKSCETTPRKPHKLCNYIDKACDAAPFQSVRLSEYTDMACDPCVASSTPYQLVKSSKDVCVQVPEKGECCKCIEELFIIDSATVPAEYSSADLWLVLWHFGTFYRLFVFNARMGTNS